MGHAYLGTANLTVQNFGHIHGFANALATSPDDAFASATAIGVRQAATEDGVVTGLVTNGPYNDVTGDGAIVARANATALAGDTATANAYAFGVSQSAYMVAMADFTVQKTMAWSLRMRLAMQFRPVAARRPTLSRRGSASGVPRLAR